MVQTKLDLGRLICHLRVIKPRLRVSFIRSCPQTKRKSSSPPDQHAHNPIHALKMHHQKCMGVDSPSQAFHQPLRKYKRLIMSELAARNRALMHVAHSN